MSDERVELSTATAADYLRERSILPSDADPTARELGGGVSNRVIEVAWDGERRVLKQPLPNLAVEDDWPADVERIHNESEAMRTYARVIDDVGLDGVRVPAVLDEDEDDDVAVIEAAPERATMWKRELLDGRVDVDVAADVGAVLGAVHDATADDPTVRDRFASKLPFEQLRVDPYHYTTAERHADRPAVAEAIRAEAERTLGVDRTLVHGDYSPKNVLVDREDGETWLLDFEVAHWGDPAFDTGFMLNHLFIKSIYNAGTQEAYLDAATAFWAAYDERVPWDVERETVAELGVLMLARVDGKSPVEYVEEGPVADALRRTAVAALLGEVTTLTAFADRARAEAPR